MPHTAFIIGATGFIGGQTAVQLRAEGWRVSEKIVPQIAKGSARIPGSGNNRVAIIHVKDVARGLAHIVSLPHEVVTGRAWILTDQSKVTLREYFDAIADLLGSRKARSVPAFLASIFAGKPMIETMTRDVQVQSSSLANTGFNLSYPSYREGLPPSLAALGYPKASAGPRTTLHWSLLFALTIAFLVAENTLHFRYSVPAMRELAHGRTMLDMRFGYTPADVADLFSALGETGRRRYVELLWSVDLVLPALMGMSLWKGLRMGRHRELSWLGPTAAMLDYAENILITALLVAYPNQNPLLALAASALTCAKLTSYLLAFSIAAFALATRACSMRRHTLWRS